MRDWTFEMDLNNVVQRKKDPRNQRLSQLRHLAPLFQGYQPSEEILLAVRTLVNAMPSTQNDPIQQVGAHQVPIAPATQVIEVDSDDEEGTDNTDSDTDTESDSGSESGSESEMGSDGGSNDEDDDGNDGGNDEDGGEIDNDHELSHHFNASMHIASPPAINFDFDDTLINLTTDEDSDDDEDDDDESSGGSDLDSDDDDVTVIFSYPPGGTGGPQASREPSGDRESPLFVDDDPVTSWPEDETPAQAEDETPEAPSPQRESPLFIVSPDQGQRTPFITKIESVSRSPPNIYQTREPSRQTSVFSDGGADNPVDLTDDEDNNPLKRTREQSSGGDDDDDSDDDGDCVMLEVKRPRRTPSPGGGSGAAAEAITPTWSWPVGIGE